MGRIFEKRKESIFKTAAQKSKLYSNYAKQLYMAAKNGVPDPEANPALRSLVDFLPQARKTLSGEDLSLFEKLLGMLNDCDDVQEIYHNVALPS